MQNAKLKNEGSDRPALVRLSPARGKSVSGLAHSKTLARGRYGAEAAGPRRTRPRSGRKSWGAGAALRGAYGGLRVIQSINFAKLN